MNALTLEWSKQISWGSTVKLQEIIIKNCYIQSDRRMFRLQIYLKISIFDQPMGIVSPDSLAKFFCPTSYSMEVIHARHFVSRRNVLTEIWM
jgi:hypothetical protein